MAKNHIILIITISIVCIIIFFTAYFLFLFNDEFVTVSIVYTGEDIEILRDPDDFIVTELSRFTSINAIWQNETKEDCNVVITSSDGSDEFILKGGQVYGSFLPKVDEIKIMFCGVEKDVKFKK